jgi:hypothetical protein
MMRVESNIRNQELPDSTYRASYQKFGILAYPSNHNHGLKKSKPAIVAVD